MSGDATPSDIESAIRSLDTAVHRIRACDWPADLEVLELPGLYAWWVDGSGSKDLSDGLSHPVAEGRIYAGQAGATKWPSGKRGNATLGSRISGQHIRGRVRSSTFRLTLAAALWQALDLQVVGPKKLRPESEAKLSEWIKQHLSVAVHPSRDRDTLGRLEDSVLRALDPPLNLRGMDSTPVRERLRDLRSTVVGLTPNAPPPRVRSPRASRLNVPSAAGSPRVTLHKEIQAILEATANWMTTAEIAAEVNARRRYRKRDGSAVTAFQVHGRTRNYPELFEREGTRVRLR